MSSLELGIITSSPLSTEVGDFSVLNGSRQFDDPPEHDLSELDDVQPFYSSTKPSETFSDHEVPKVEISSQNSASSDDHSLANDDPTLAREASYQQQSPDTDATPLESHDFPGKHDVYCFRSNTVDSSLVHRQTLHIHDEDGRCMYWTDGCTLGRLCNGVYILAGTKTYCVTSDMITSKVPSNMKIDRRLRGEGCTKIGVLEKDKPEDRYFRVEVAHDIARHFERDSLFKSVALKQDVRKKSRGGAGPSSMSKQVDFCLWPSSLPSASTFKICWDGDADDSDSNDELHSKLGVGTLTEVKQRPVSILPSQRPAVVLTSEARSSQVREGCLVTKKTTMHELMSLQRYGLGLEEIFLGVVISLGEEQVGDAEKEGISKKRVLVQPFEPIADTLRRVSN